MVGGHQAHCCWLLLVGLLIAGHASHAEPFPADIVVAQDGAGDFTSIQAAIDSIPLDNRRRVVVEVRPGLYQERVRIDQSGVTLRGTDRKRTRIAYNFPRTEYDRRYDRLGPGVVNLFGEDLILRGLTIENTQPAEAHAFAVYGQPQRLILDDCEVLGEGGDTLSLWNTSFGMYYHRNCRFRGGVDFVCPRGWCFVRDSQFESVGTSAAIWHDGYMDVNMKFVVRNSAFDGPDDFWLGRNHYPSQFYLLDCRFTERMADKAILVVSEPRPGVDPALYEQKYYVNCHRAGGDFDWFADNLQEAPGELDADSITPAWTFDNKWDPEGTAPPRVESVELDGESVHVYFSEPLAGSSDVVVVRDDGTTAALVGGEGTRHFTFSGGTPSSAPSMLQPAGRGLYAVTATLEPRYIADGALPPPTPRKQVKLLLVGDSTVASYDANHAYQGWGWALGQFFDARVAVDNHARGGRSSKSFRDEGHWRRALEMQPDYLLVQFGHNDNPGKGPERETNPAKGGDFRANLAQYVREARQQGAIPVLVSPPTRRRYLADGRIDPAEGNVPYAEATLAVARELDCPVIDLNRLTRQLFNRLEESHSDWIQPVGDRTHFTPKGARRVAQVVADQLQTQIEELRLLVINEQLMRP